ncbi:hypothetical protein N431DRAFT_4215 [Stipitochalara longipes BDJ]|nr:hypothetical protein N431DRAFT_4215 [Stipitochalara longipes BDJ]
MHQYASLLPDEGCRQKHCHERNCLRLRLWTVVGALAVTTLCTLLFLMSSWTEPFNTNFHSSKNTTASDDMKLQIIIPSFGTHFPLLVSMLHSMACLMTDIETVDVAIILSSASEVVELRTLLDDFSVTETCTPDYLNYNTSHATHLRYPPILTLHNLYDIVAPSVQNLTNPEDTTDLLRFRKYKYQSLKKIGAAAYFDYDYAIMLDSEGFVLRPVAFKEMVRQWASGPVVWYETWPAGSPRHSDWIVGIHDACAHTLGRTNIFGGSVSFWEGFIWVLEKDIIMDMVNSPSRLEPGIDFWTRMLNAPADIFEYSLYRTHIVGRKQEQSSTDSSIYTKYKVLNMKDALFDFGLEAAYNRLPTGGDMLAEILFYMLQEEPLQDLLIEFLKQHKEYFVHFKPEYVDLVDRKVLESFLRKAPLAMSVCGANTLPVDVIPSAQLDGAWNMTYV